MFEPTIMRIQKLPEHRSFGFDEKKCLADAIQELEILNKSNDYQFSKEDIPDLIRVILARPAATSSSSADLKFQNLSKYTSELAKNRFSSRFFPCADKNITRSTAFLLFWLYAATHELKDVFTSIGDPGPFEHKSGKDFFRNRNGAKFSKEKFESWLKKMCPKTDVDDLFKNLDSYTKYFVVSKYTCSKDEYILHFKDQDFSLKTSELKYGLFASEKVAEEKPGVSAAVAPKEAAPQRTGSSISSAQLRPLSVSELVPAAGGSSPFFRLTNRLQECASSVWRAYYFNPNSYPIHSLRDLTEKFFFVFPNGLRRRRRAVSKQGNPLLVGASATANTAVFSTPAEIYDHFLRNKPPACEIPAAKDEISLGISKKPEQDRQILGNELVLRRQHASSGSASKVYRTLYKLEGLMLKFLQAYQFNPNFDPHFKVQPFFGFPEVPRNRRRATAALMPVVPKLLGAPPLKEAIAAESSAIFSTPLPESICDKPKFPMIGVDVTSLTLGVDTSCLTREVIDGISRSFTTVDHLNASIDHSTSPRTRETRLGNIANAVAAGQIILDPNAHTTADEGDGFTGVKLVTSRDFQVQTNLDSEESGSDSDDFDSFTKNGLDFEDEDFFSDLPSMPRRQLDTMYDPSVAQKVKEAEKAEQEKREKAELEKKEKAEQEKAEQEKRKKAEQEFLVKTLYGTRSSNELNIPFGHLPELRRESEKSRIPPPKGFYSEGVSNPLPTEQVTPEETRPKKTVSFGQVYIRRFYRTKGLSSSN